MKINEIIEQVKKSNPNALKGVPEKKAVALVRAAFSQVGTAVDEADEGVVKVASFGRFKIVKKEREVEGGKEVLKRVFFTPALPKKEKKADAK